MPKRHDPAFEKFLREHVSLRGNTGLVKVDDAYASLGFNIMWGGTSVPVPYTHLIWFLIHNRWPKDGYHIDHINDDSLDNSPTNLQEITIQANHEKRRGRKVYRSYGTGKYGYGLGIYNDKRDNRFYITRDMSRGHGKGDLKGVKISLGGFDTFALARKKVKELAAEIEANGLDHVPLRTIKNQRCDSVEPEVDKIRNLRAKGHTIEQIASITGFSQATICNKTKDMNIDKRLKK